MVRAPPAARIGSAVDVLENVIGGVELHGMRMPLAAREQGGRVWAARMPAAALWWLAAAAQKWRQNASARRRPPCRQVPVTGALGRCGKGEAISVAQRFLFAGGA
jgi:hypothetical protein